MVIHSLVLSQKDAGGIKKMYNLPCSKDNLSGSFFLAFLFSYDYKRITTAVKRLPVAG